MGIQRINGTPVDLSVEDNRYKALWGKNVRIAATNKKLSGTSIDMVDATGFCVTEPYPVSAGTYDQQNFAVHIVSADGVGKCTMQFLRGNKPSTYYDVQTKTADSSGIDGRPCNSFYYDTDGVRFTLVTAYAPKCYAYWVDSGEIIFAGSETPFFGLDSIYGGNNGIEAYKREYGGGGFIRAAKYPNLPTAFVDRVVANYTSWMNEIHNDFDKIPIIAVSDMHGFFSNQSGPTLSRELFGLICDLTDWNRVSRFADMGDTAAGDAWYAGGMKNYLKLIGRVPMDKRIEIRGNHDVYNAAGSGGGYYPADQTALNRYFRSYNERRGGNNGYFVAIDDYYNIKYVVPTCTDFDGTGTTNENAQKISTQQANFLIEELEKADGYDVVIMSHSPLSYELTTRSGSTHHESWKFLPTLEEEQAFQTLIAARKNKTSGTYVDTDGVSHAYDFSQCNSELLMCLSGHTHVEAYKDVQNAFTIYSFDRMEITNLIFTFAYIDRKSKKFKAWKSDMTADHEPWEIDLL